MSRVFDYADFSFGLIRTAPRCGVDIAANMERLFMNETIPTGDGTLEEYVLPTVKCLAERAGLENVMVKKFDGLSVSIYEDSEWAGYVVVVPHIPDEKKKMVMPNGDRAFNLFTYGWKGVKKLEGAA